MSEFDSLFEGESPDARKTKGFLSIKFTPEVSNKLHAMALAVTDSQGGTLMGAKQKILTALITEGFERFKTAREKARGNNECV